MRIGTPRLLLAPVKPSDVDDLCALDADPAVMRFVNGGLPTPRRDISDWVIPRAQAEYAAHGTGLWTIRFHSDGTFAGWVSLRTPRHSSQSELELSYRLTAATWGRGVATEATLALITMAFDELEVNRIFASTHAANGGSQRIMQKMGMRLSAMHLSDRQIDSGFEHDEVEYELMASQWRARQPRHGVWAADDAITESWAPDHAQYSA